MNKTISESLKDFLNTYHIDKIARFSTLLSNLIYFVIILLYKQKRKHSFFPIHHVNFVGLLISILVVSWSFHSYPNLNNNLLNILVCYLSELLWGTLKFVRAYSILILAIYRYIAVFKPKEYRLISKSCRYTIWTTLSVWLIPFLIFFFTKYSTGTTHGYQCFDGYSKNSIALYLYFGISHFFGIILPCVLVILIYIRIHKKINRKRKRKIQKRNVTNRRLESIQYDSSANSTSTRNATSKQTAFRISIRKHKENSLALQLIILNTLEIISFVNVFLITVPLELLIQGFDQNLLRLILGPFTGLIFTTIPILTIYFLFKIK